MTAAKRWCVYCRREIFKATSGTWYHRHNASTSCRLGWSSSKATPR